MIPDKVLLGSGAVDELIAPDDYEIDLKSEGLKSDIADEDTLILDEAELEEVLSSEVAELSPSFGEVSLIVASLEDNLSGLVISNQITPEQEKELKEILNQIELGQYASLTTEEITRISEAILLLPSYEIQKLIQDLAAKDNVELLRVPKLFGEEGFLSLSDIARSELSKNAHTPFIEMVNEVEELEKQLIQLVKQGLITSDQAYEMRDKVLQAPIDQSVSVLAQAKNTVAWENVISQDNASRNVDAFIDSDYKTIAQQQIVVIEQEVNGIDQNVAASGKSNSFGEEGFLSVGDARDFLSQGQRAEVYSDIEAYEEKLIELVDQGAITNDQAYEMRDKARDDFALGDEVTLPAVQLVTPETQETIVTREQLRSSVDYVLPERALDVKGIDVPQRGMAKEETYTFGDDFTSPDIEYVEQNSVGIEEPESPEPSIEARGPEAIGIEPRTLAGGSAPFIRPVERPVEGFSPKEKIAAKEQDAIHIPDPVIQRSAIDEPLAPTLRVDPPVKPAVDDMQPVAFVTKPAPGTIRSNEPMVAPQTLKFDALNTPVATQSYAKVQQPQVAFPTATVDTAEKAKAQQEVYLKILKEKEDEERRRQFLKQQEDAKKAEAKKTEEKREPNLVEERDYKKGPCEGCHNDCSQCGVPNALSQQQIGQVAAVTSVDQSAHFVPQKAAPAMTLG